MWGCNCPAVDLDFLLVEYNIGKPVALVEYKHIGAWVPDIKHATYRALADLADGYRLEGLPFLITFYSNEDWWFRVHPINQMARKHFSDGQILTEREYVTTLYRIRAFKVKDDVLAKLSDRKPAMATAI